MLAHQNPIVAGFVERIPAAPLYGDSAQPKGNHRQIGRLKELAGEAAQ
jgi:hypothetical protein